MTKPLLLLESPWAGITILSTYKNTTGEIIDFVIEQANTTAQKQFAYLDIQVGKKFSEVFPLNTELLSVYRKVLDTKTPVEYEVCIPDNGTDVWWRNRCFVYQGESFVLISENITLVKTQQAQLLSLAQRNEDLDMFVYTASHDLSSPLNNLEALINHLAQEVKGKSQNADLYISLVNKTITNLKSTLQDLTTVTEIHPGEKKELVNLSDVIEEVKVLLYKQIEESSATIELDLTIPFLTIPKKHVKSLLFNLFSNALKFRSKDRKLRIKISSYLKDNRIHISFSDNGMGIKEADQDKVFMIFKRFTKGVEGRGVGMYLVKRVIDLNEGNIHLQSKENVGTSFHIDFPIDQ